MRMNDRARAELGDFLTRKRNELSPGSAGVPSTGRRRAPGLRREEVAYLSGVSLTWYTWLEQGRDINPSRQVLDALARTLQLVTAEHEYVLRLTGHASEPALAQPSVTLAPHGQRLLDALGDSPAYAITDHWSIIGWNRAYELLYPPVATTPVSDRNLLWLVFTDTYVHALLADWEADSRRFLTQFRAEAGARLHDSPFVELVTRLLEASEHFRVGWERHNVDHFESSERNFNHPHVGDLQLEHHRVSLSDCPDVHLVIYTPVAGTGTTQKLRDLRSR